VLEVHISSAIVQARPSEMAAVLEELAAIPGLCVHAVENGKIVITLETASEHALAQQLNRMSLLDGVYAATLVSHYIDTQVEPTP
jgi:periplasmic nitrate reductase NapD